LPPEILEKQVPASIIPWPVVQPEWETDGPAREEVVLPEEETVMEMAEPR
jgi:hypothetical protein